MFYAYFLSPVRHIPGPFWSRVTPIPLRLASFKSKRYVYTSGLLQKYGPIVVIAPDQVHTSDDEAMKIIYDRNSPKTSFYTVAGKYKGVNMVLGTIDHSSAVSIRSNLLQCFQNKNLSSLSDAIESHLSAFVKFLYQRADRNEAVLDGIFWLRLLTLDTVTDILWGDKHDLVNNRSHENSALMTRFHQWSKFMALRGFIPGFELWVRTCGTKYYKELRRGWDTVDIYARQALEKWEAGETKSHSRDVLSMLLAMNSKKDLTKKNIPVKDLPVYMVEAMSAGSGTTSNTTTLAFWMIARHKAVQDRLRRELFEVFPAAEEIDMKQCLNIKYLEWVIYEVMRLWPILPGPLYRHLGQPITVNGLTVPQRVIASTAAIDQHKLPDIFPEPEMFNPERWRDATESMKRNWIPFGYGSRSCPGQNLGLTELKYFVAVLLRHFRCEIPEGMQESQIELRDPFTATVWERASEKDPWKNEVLLKFVPQREAA